MKDTRVRKAVKLFREAEIAVDNIYKLVGREVIKLCPRE
jgi:hypothetical protein